MNTVIAWIVGLVLSALVGYMLVGVFLFWLRAKLGVPFEKESPGVSPGITGGMERIFFSSLVAADASGYATAMIVWLALKLVANWNRPDETERTRRLWGISGLVAGLMSLWVALLGGLFIKWLAVNV